VRTIRGIHLYAIGIDPGRQGTGVASALLRSRLDRCDRDEQSAYLEATKASSVPLYQHFRFEPTGPPDLPAGAPPLTAMWRLPARGAEGLRLRGDAGLA
jgi:GNAT superfamily N-acetyltransferase